MTDGPTALEYLERRLDLMAASIDKLERVIDQRFQAVDDATTLALRGVNERFIHMEQLNSLSTENAKRAVDKAEAAQSAHNVAANEWRGTLNDFKSTLIGRSEFERFYGEFSSYRLEAARMFAAAAGERSGSRETKEDHKSMIAIVISIASAAVMVVTFALQHLKP